MIKRAHEEQPLVEGGELDADSTAAESFTTAGQVPPVANGWAPAAPSASDLAFGTPGVTAAPVDKQTHASDQPSEQARMADPSMPKGVKYDPTFTA